MTAHRLILPLLLALPLAPALAQSAAPAPAATTAARAPGKNEQQALKWFSMLDANGDGRISREEAKVAFRLKPSLAEVFLHDIQIGPASRSYGVQVARLAGMPAALIRQARQALEALEAQQRKGDAQAELFAAPAAIAAAAPSPSPLELALQGIDADSLTPRQALDALYRLKQLQQEQSA